MRSHNVTFTLLYHMCPIYCPLLFVFVCCVVYVIGHKNEMKYILNVNLESTVQFGVVLH